MGDSITNFLCIEEALAYLQVSVAQNLLCYEDLQCANTKVAVKDKSKLKVVYTEDRITSPASV